MNNYNTIKCQNLANEVSERYNNNADWSILADGSVKFDAINSSVVIRESDDLKSVFQRLNDNAKEFYDFGFYCESLANEVNQKYDDVDWDLLADGRVKVFNDYTYAYINETDDYDTVEFKLDENAV